MVVQFQIMPDDHPQNLSSRNSLEGLFIHANFFILNSLISK